MAIDYDTHPAGLVGSGTLDQDKRIDVKRLREAIPSHCFELSYKTALYYIFRDLTYVTALFYLAICQIPSIENAYLRCLAWALYGWAQGLVFMAIWTLGHECGHAALLPTEWLNHALGFLIHTSSMTPYFAWRSTHRRHHIYHNNLAKDHAYVPPRRDEYETRLRQRFPSRSLERLEELSEDAPIVTFLRIVWQQLIGWPWYLLTNIAASPTSLPGGKSPSEVPLGNSHFAPTGVLFRREEFWVVLFSDIGLCAMAAVLLHLGNTLGHGNMLLLYGQPYVWLNHWIIAITFLHHTHPDVPKYEDEAWTFVKGATATVDRQMGWISKHLWHNLVDFHVIHHLFSRIPFYHTEEATNAIIPLLSDSYHSDKNRAFLPAIWESFTKCQWVEPTNPESLSGDQVMRYKGGIATTPVLSD